MEPGTESILFRSELAGDRSWRPSHMDFRISDIIPKLSHIPKQVGPNHILELGDHYYAKGRVLFLLWLITVLQIRRNNC